MSSLDTWFAGIAAAATLVGVGYAAWQVRMIAKDMGRRAKFEVEVSLESPTPIRSRTLHPDDKVNNVFVVARPRGEQLDGVLRIQFRNTGKRRAQYALMNVNAPTYLDDFYFSNQRGEQKLEPVMATTGSLIDLNGLETPAFFLSRVYDVIARRHDYLSFVHFRAYLGPDLHQGDDAYPRSIPFYIVLDSDDLPDKSLKGEEAHLWVEIENGDERGAVVDRPTH